MSTTIKVCPVCAVSWYADKPAKHMMTCTAGLANRYDAWCVLRSYYLFENGDVMTMREKMARAMLERYASINGYVVPSILPQTKLAWHLEMTDAALDALMEPTEGMIEAYDKTPWPHDDGPEMPDAYQNMIRAAREGK